MQFILIALSIILGIFLVISVIVLIVLTVMLCDASKPEPKPMPEPELDFPCSMSRWEMDRLVRRLMKQDKKLRSKRRGYCW